MQDDNEQLRVYVQDNGWRGCIIVIAKSADAARLLMRNESNYEETGHITSYLVAEGFTFANYGDM